VKPILHPILFSAPMVRALLAGTKTQTRRPMKPAPDADVDGVLASFATDVTGARAGFAAWFFHDQEPGPAILCPYGGPGHRLWVREAWARDDADGQLLYRADVGQGGEADDWDIQRRDGVPGYRWKPSIHMPRSACRIELEITDVRVERLQAISVGDAMAEGVTSADAAGLPSTDDNGWKPIDAYRQLWDTINMPATQWRNNPWVWVVEFRRLTP
jgi:hypothetical protein